MKSHARGGEEGVDDEPFNQSVDPKGPRPAGGRAQGRGLLACGCEWVDGGGGLGRGRGGRDGVYVRGHEGCENSEALSKPAVVGYVAQNGQNGQGQCDGPAPSPVSGG